MPAVSRDLGPIVVQYARGLPTSDQGWTTSYRLNPIRASRTTGITIGTAEIEEYLGANKPPGTTRTPVVDIRTPELAVGMYVRFLASAPLTGSVTVMMAGREFKLRQFWVGIVTGYPRAIIGGDDEEPLFGQSRIIRWRCEDLRVILSRIMISDALVLTNGTPQWLGRPLDFNPDLGFGNKTFLNYTVNGRSIPVFDLNPGTAYPWSGSDILNYAAVAHGMPTLPDGSSAVGSIIWGLGTQGGQGKVAVKASDGPSLLTLIERVAPESRGLTWWLDHAAASQGNYVPMGMTSTSPTAIGYTDSLNFTTITVPAAATQRALDLRANQFVVDHSFVADSNGFDVLVVESSERPTRIVTLRKADLLPDGWTLSDAVVRGDNNVWGPWQTFNIDPASATFLAQLNNVTDATNEFRRKAGPNPPTIQGLELTSDLGVARGFSTAGGDPQRPVICYQIGGYWQQLDGDVSMRQTPLGVDLGSTTSHAVKLRSSTDFTVTLGVKEWSTLKVWWIRNRSQWPSDIPRIKRVQVPGVAHISSAPGIVIGADGYGNLLELSPETVFTDYRYALMSTLAELRARYEVQGGTVTWTESACEPFLHNQGEAIAYELGTLITTVATPDGLVTANAVVSAIEWDFVNATATWTTQRPATLPDYL